MFWGGVDLRFLVQNLLLTGGKGGGGVVATSFVRPGGCNFFKNI